MNVDRLKTLMERSGMNKSQIAQRCGVSRTTLDHILTGADAKMSTAQALATVLGVRVGYLFDESSSETDQLLADLHSLRLTQTTSEKDTVSLTVRIDRKELEKLRRE